MQSNETVLTVVDFIQRSIIINSVLITQRKHDKIMGGGMPYKNISHTCNSFRVINQNIYFSLLVVY